MKKYLGVVLAGGQSRRFGSPKAFAKIKKKPFYKHAIEAIQPFTDKQVIMTSSALKDEFEKGDHHLKVYTDDPSYAGKGPLAGVWTAMLREKADWYVTIPVDVPMMEARIFQRLLEYTDENIDAVIPVEANRLQPLTAVYHASVKESLRENLEQDKLSVRQLLERIQVKYVPFEAESPFMNINNQEDFHKMIRKNNGGK